MIDDPRWLVEAEKHIGQAEVPGVASNPWIKSLWLALKSGEWFWKSYGEDDSKLPWCGGFVAYCLDKVGIVYPKNYASAKAWADWGKKLVSPERGCIVVFERQGGGHVGFVVGRTLTGNLLVLGGNQDNKVKVSEFSRERVVGYYWPPGEPEPMHRALLVMPATGELSRNEA